MAYQGNPGISRLGAVLSERTRAHMAGASALVLDYASVQKDLSLLPNTFPVSIPKSDYTVCRHIAGMELSVSGGQHGGHTEGDGRHSHTCTAPALRPGDRVLIAWVQNDVTVIDVIVPASRI